MHLLLTDRLCCPRCGPDLGLILRADRMESRLVIDGVLGCPECREAFPIEQGFADLRVPPREPLGQGLAGGPPEGVVAETARPAAGGDEERARRVVALLGVVGGAGALALVGEPARLAPRVAVALPELLVVAIDSDLRSWPECAGVNRLAADAGIPLFSSALRGIAVDGRLGPAWLAEAARVAQPRARVVVLHATPHTRAALEERGLTVLATEAETIVAARS